jgi:hypothetical protein
MDTARASVVEERPINRIRPALIRIVVADDHAIVRDGLKQFIAGEEDMVVSGEAAPAPTAISTKRAPRSNWLQPSAL